MSFKGFGGPITAVLNGSGTTTLTSTGGTITITVVGNTINFEAAGGGGTVTTTGSPANGNLTKFSGTSSITNGDLSGDVITTNTLATTIAKIQGKTVSGTTGTVNVVFSNSPTISGSLNLSSLTASQALVLDSGKNVTTIGYSAVGGISNLVSRDAQGNTFLNDYAIGIDRFSATGSIIGLINTAPRLWRTEGSGTQPLAFPDATTIPIGQGYEFSNNTTQPMGLYAGDGATLLATVPVGGYARATSLDNGTINGQWIITFDVPLTGLLASQGGTGLGTLTAHAVMLGEGTSNVGFATIGTSGRLLIDQGAGVDPSFNAVSGDFTITNTGVATIKTNVALAGSPTTTTQSQGDSSTKIATTAYTDIAIANAIAGVNPAVAVQAATAAILPNTPTYNNGVSGIGATITAGVTNTALVVDGYTPTLNQRILVKNEAGGGGLGASRNGVYFVSQIAALGLAWILTRAIDYDMPSDINNTGAIPVTNGTVNLDTSWVLTSQVTTVGTDALTYVQFTINPTTILTTALNSTNIFVGNGSNIATGVAMSGDATLDNTGKITVSFARSEVWLDTGNGNGSTNTVIPIFLNTNVNTGTAITYASTAAAGSSFTINEAGVYGITYTDTLQGTGASSPAAIGISLNSAQLTTSIQTITASTRLVDNMISAAAATKPGTCSVQCYLSVNDVIRPHKSSNFNAGLAETNFHIVKISK